MQKCMQAHGFYKLDKLLYTMRVSNGQMQTGNTRRYFTYIYIEPTKAKVGVITEYLGNVIV